MPAVSRTATFRSLIPTHTPGSSSSASSSPRASSPTPSKSRSVFTTRRSRVRRSEKEVEEDKLRKEFGDEAHRIHRHLDSLSKHLVRVRSAYLATGSGLPSHRRRHHAQTQPRRSPRSPSLSGERESSLSDSKLAVEVSSVNSTEADEEEESLRQLESLPWLTELERDEVELRAKVIVRGCGGRISLLSRVEEARKSLHASQHVTPSSILSTLLPSIASATSSIASTTNATSLVGLSVGGPTTETQLSAHHSSIILFLNTELLKASAQLTEMCEERWRIRKEREMTLGGMVGGGGVEGLTGDDETAEGGSVWDVLKGGSSKDANARTGAETWRGVKLTVPTDPGLAARAAAQSGSGQFTFSVTDDPEDEDASLPAQPLTEAQIQEFSSESSQLLDSMSTTLDSALLAERSLLEISSLQSTLITHLQTQTETIDLLYDDAIGTVGEVERANVQLRKAKERGGSARLFLLVFLIGSSFALLFLDYYS